MNAVFTSEQYTINNSYFATWSNIKRKPYRSDCDRLRHWWYTRKTEIRRFTPDTRESKRISREGNNRYGSKIEHRVPR